MKRLLIGTMMMAAICLGGQRTALAQDATCTIVPGVSNSIGETDFVGESATFSVEIDNVDSGTGFRPGLDLFLPVGLQFASAQFAGGPVDASGVIVIPASGDFTHPLTLEPLTGTPGESFVFLPYPITAQPQSMPALQMDITVDIDSDAVVGTVLTPTVDCGYLFGSDAINDPLADPPDRERTTTTVNPVFVIVTKRVDNAVCTGSSYVFDWFIEIDVAEGQTLDAFSISDELPGNFQITTVSPGAGAVITLPGGPGGTLELSHPNLLGVAGLDTTLLVSGFVIDGTVDLNAPGNVAVTNSVTLHGNGGIGSDLTSNGDTGSVSPVTTSAITQAGPFQVSESIAPAPLLPGETATVTLSICISDNIDINAVDVTSVLDDGLTYNDNSGLLDGAFLDETSIAGTGPTSIVFSLGNLAGGDRTTLVYTTLANQNYVQTGEPVLAGDQIETTQTLTGLLAATNAPATVNEAGSINDDTAQISSSVFTKNTISPVDGTVVAGESVTFDLRASFVSGDIDSVVLTDFLPKPIFNAPDCVATPEADNDFSLTGTVTQDVAADNFIELTFAPIESAVTAEVLLHFTLTCSVLNGPADDGFVFTNVAQILTTNTTTTISSFAFTALELEVPEIQIFKEASATTADAGDTLTYTILIANDGSADAFDVFVSDLIPTGLSPSAGPTIAGASFVGAAADLFTPTGVEISTLAGADLATITYDVTVDSNVSANTQLDNLAIVTNFESEDDPGAANHANPSSDFTSISRVTISQFEPSNELADLADRTRVVGEDYLYDVIVGIPEGEHDGVVFTYTLDAGLVFVETLNEDLSDVQCGPAGGPFAACVLPVPVVSGDRRTVTWTFSDAISNPPDADTEVIVFSLRAAVEDDGTNAIRGAALNSNLNITGANSASSTITVIEPTLVGSGTFTGVGDGGDTITLTTSLSHLAASNSDAHDVQLVYSFAGTDLSPVANAALDITNCANATSAIAAGNSITIQFATLPDGNSCSVPASVVLANGVTNGSQLTVPAAVSWESILGDGGFEGIADERAYTASFTATYTVTTAALTKSLIASSRAETSGTGLAVGERGTYRLTVTVPDGSNPATVVCDDPPTGLAIVGFSVDALSFIGTITPPAAPVSGGQGQQLCWNFGTVVATSGVGTVGNSFTIDVVAEVEFVSNMAAGSPQNNADLSIGGSEQVSVDAGVEFALPAPTIALAANDTTPSTGDTVNFTATLTNSNDAPVCDTTLTVEVPAGFSLVNFDTDGLDNDQDGATDEGDESGMVSGSTITFPVNSTNASGGCLDDTDTSLVFPFNVTVDDGIPPTSVNASATLGSYGSLPNGEGDSLSPADDDTDNNGVGGVDEAGDGTATLGMLPTAPNLVFEKLASDDNGGLFEPNDRITYTITLQNTGTGPATGVSFSDVIPTNNASFVSGSETITPDTLSVTEAGGTLSSTIGTLANGSSVVITFQMDIDSPLPTGSTVINQAAANADDGYGPLVSDDPSTGTANDATSISTASTADGDGDGVCTDAVAVPGVCIAGPDIDPNDPNVCADADGDGCNDCAVVFPPDPANDGLDGESDGICDAGDIDIDNDGIPNTLENSLGVDPLGDNDNDGVLNFEDPDDQGDGAASNCINVDADATTCDLISELFDTDQDGIPDFRDLDADNDGIADVIEAGHGAADADGDGMVDGPYNGSGISSLVDADDDEEIDYVIRDTDDDGTPDFQDVDSDGDGLTDIEESGQGGLDGDGDGRIDSPVDADGDGLDENVDTDDNVYGGTSLTIAGLIAGFDTDGDGIPDPYDVDDDGAGGDSNDDGFDDDIQCPNPPGWPACPDADGDGTPDYSEPIDTDGDGVSDANDLDTDNDGIPDTDETPLGFDPYGDNDGDGIPNFLDVNDRGDGMPQVCEDLDADLECDVPGADYDSDGDGIANHLDLDSDNDGIPDVVEAGHGRDTGDGFVDCPSGFGDNGLCDDVESAPDSGVRNYPILNTDGESPTGDDVPDFLDIDSDGDGEFDISEVDALAGFDTDDDGRIDDAVDGDGDGIMSVVDDDDATRGFPGVATDPTVNDADGDGIPDAYDVDSEGPGAGDSDEDGIPDDIECNGSWPCQDIDGDGIPDYMETPDADGDGIPDFLDLDDDNDGIRDVDESPLGLDGSLDNDNDGIPNAIDVDDRGDGMASDCDDLDGNGACDAVSSDFDFDGDGIPNHFDLDADGDGIFDADESGFGAADADRDGILDCPAGFGDNGLCNNVETGVETGETNEPKDTDSDDAPDFLDLDSDGDTISDEDESGDGDLGTPPIDTDGDGTPDYNDLDTDGDGIPDDVEAGDTDLDTDPIDTDGDGTPDFRDTDSDDDGIDDEDESGDDPSDPVDTDGDGTPDFQDPDADGDGINDGEDNCRLIANADQVDSDLDGFGAACDADDNGDGYDDDIGVVGGGGCSTSGTSTGSLVALLFALLLLGLQRRKTRMFIGSALATLLFVGTAHAQPVEAQTEYSVERFRLSTDRQGILDVESANIPKHLSFDIGLWLGYADDPLNIYREVNGERKRIGSLVSHRLGGSLVGSFALWKRLQIGMAIPVVLSQDQDVEGIMGPPTSVSSIGLGDLRLVPKLQFLRAEDHWLDMSFSLGFTLPTQTSSDYFGSSSAMFQPELQLSKPFTKKWRGAMNLGYQTRKRQRALNLIVDDEIYTDIGAAYMVTKVVELDATFSAATGADDIFGDFNRNSSELRLGAAYYLGGMVLFAAGGLGTSAGFGTPDWRGLAGVRFGKLREEKKTILAKPQPPAPSDGDADGIVDQEDKCPTEAETVNQFEDSDGCPDEVPDMDNDGINDLNDKCINQPEDIDTFEDADGCPDLDNDADGVLDTEDACPLVFGVTSNAGCPEKDTDGDTVVDSQDNCPNIPGDVDNAGCKTKQVVKLVDGKLDLLDKVYFRTNKAVIRPISYDLLKNVAAVLKAHPELTKIRVEGHTDSRGRDAYNKKLSQRRTESVVKFLVKEGVDKARLEAVGFGEEKPIASNDTDEGRASNRRVEFKIVGDAKGISNKNSGPTKDTIGE